MSFLLIFITIELAAITAALFAIQLLRSVAQKPESGKAFAWASVLGAAVGISVFFHTYHPSKGDLAYTTTKSVSHKNYFSKSADRGIGTSDTDTFTNAATGMQTIDIEEGYGITSYRFMYRQGGSEDFDRFVLATSVFLGGINQYKHVNDYFIHAVWPIKREYLIQPENPQMNVPGVNKPILPSGIVPMDDVVNGENFLPSYAATTD